MAVKAFSTEWASAFKDEVNKSSVYQQAGKGWKWTVGLVVEAEPDKHFPEARGIVMDLYDGKARNVTVGGAAATWDSRAAFEHVDGAEVERRFGPLRVKEPGVPCGKRFEESVRPRHARIVGL